MDMCKLINTFKSRPILWDSRRDEYKLTEKKAVVWKEIADKFGTTPEEELQRQENVESILRIVFCLFQVKRFSKKHGQRCSVALITIEGNSFSACGVEFICKSSAVRDACKAAFNEQKMTCEATIDSNPVLSMELSSVLKTHVFDMDVGLMRVILSQSVCPAESCTNKDARRNMYKASNAPHWWTRTGLAFKSPNHPRNRKRFMKAELWVLVHSLQQYLGVVVEPPKKRPKESVNFVSYDGVGETECGDDASVVEDVDGGGGSANDTDSAGVLLTDDEAVDVDEGVRGDDDNLGEVEGGEVSGRAGNVEGGSGARADETDRSGETTKEMMTNDEAVDARRKSGSITDYFRPVRQPYMTPEPYVTAEAILHHFREARRCEVGASKRVMRTEDLLSLRPGEFLTDGVIDCYLDLLTVSVRPRLVLALQCQFAIHADLQKDLDVFMYEKVLFASFECILIPLCVLTAGQKKLFLDNKLFQDNKSKSQKVPGLHWMLLVAKPSSRTLTVYNPKRGKLFDATARQYIQSFQRYMATRSQYVESNLAAWEATPIVTASQTDSTSCGVFVAMIAESIVNGLQWENMGQSDANLYRSVIFKRLCASQKASTCFAAVCKHPKATKTKRLQWILCDNCMQWVHNKCADISVHPDTFICSVCGPVIAKV